MQFLEQHKIVPMYFPADLDDTVGATTSNTVSLKNYDHCLLLFEFGSIGAPDIDITIMASNDVAHSQTAALATINFRTMVTTDTWSALTTVTDSKIDLASGEDIDDAGSSLCAVELDAEEIKAASSTYAMDCVYIGIEDPVGQAVVMSSVAILSKGRYKRDLMPTAIVD